MLKSYFHSNLLEAGCDEAGRGCLAGPVVAAAVILPKSFEENRINDSKQLSEKARYELREIIEAKAVSFAIAFVDNIEIDNLNILRASIKAMHLALDKLLVIPEYILIDGNRFFPYKKIPFSCIVKGDSKYVSIAAASILAKTYRDDYMKQIAKQYSCYGWEQNKGYPTKDHRDAISKYGITELHRKSFRLINEQMELKFD